MSNSHKIAITLAIGAVLALGASAQETRIKRVQLPPAVEKSVTKISHGATVRGFTKETDNGQTYYEAEMVVNGHSKDVSMDKNGTVVEIEEGVELNSLPQDVQQALRTKAGKGKIYKVESVTKHGKVAAYEAQVMTNGKRSEVQVGPGGEALSHEE